MVARHSITVVRAPLIGDGRGNVEPDWDNPEVFELPGWAVDADGVEEDREHRDGDAVRYVLRGPATADIRPTDRVRLFGEEFRITGGVLRQYGPSSLTAHTIIRLTRWEG